jgi:glutamine synthetase
LDLGIGGVPVLPKDTTDRNRTSPMAFTGNKFELRALGSSMSIAVPNAVLNTMLAESLDDLSEKIEQRIRLGKERDPAVLEVLREIIEETKDLRYDGDCYTAAWANQSKACGLPSPTHAPAALEGLVAKSTIALFERYGILTAQEAEARYRVRLDQFVKTVAVELRVSRRMIDTQILPAALEHQQKLASSLREAGALLGANSDSLKSQRTRLEKCVQAIDQLYGLSGRLAENESVLYDESAVKNRAWKAAEIVRPLLDEARAVCDELEQYLDARLWPLPRYDELLRLS